MAFQLTVESLPFGGVGNSGMGAYHGKVSRFSYLAGYFSFEKKIAHVKIMYLVVTFCTEIVTQKFVLWCFFRSKLSEKNPQFNFSSQNLSIERNLFSNEMEK